MLLPHWTEMGHRATGYAGGSGCLAKGAHSASYRRDFPMDRSMTTAEGMTLRAVQSSIGISNLRQRSDMTAQLAERITSEDQTMYTWTIGAVAPRAEVT